ncbi:galactitol utilization operon repressor [Paenibacillus baekrokdamisoli]|uniref:Galactitol utilization operon repressor n=1 Tax=Paenibacillus baekrokdamisoli TaxID=1712516 RepID=A0A3G9JEI8_9BACL|nr:DeoR/GlpR family DNA-binding transcription regulator [Paenibacillus baekrokdamisoli]MBB3070375.1 DeoR/GlpR family transcriptional regulator of sugar metabolism [Paenibacillus baekrokdamisoli]BBH21379.1 galactitol utilization operon repressor [Paenibacillus baekrokdamisoli]
MSEQKMEELNIEERRKRILDLLHTEGKVKVIDLSKRFGISEVTIRGDLDGLEQNGLLERIHGGAVSTYKSYYNMNFHDRMGTNQEEKRKIAIEAASMINDGDTVILGSGTTPLFVVRELKEQKNLIIITNSISVAQEVGYNKNIKVVVLLGGNINAEYQFTSGDDAISQLNKYKADKLILSSDGVSPEFGVTTYHHLEAELNRQMIARVNKTIVVADYTKIGRSSFSHIEGIDKIDCLISNHNANKDDIEAIQEKGIEVRLV